MTTLETAILVISTVTGMVTLVLVVGILKWIVVVVDNARRESTPCDHVVTYAYDTDAKCVLPIGHRSDHAVTLASVEACGYNQPPF